MFETTKDLGWGGAHQNTRLAKAIAELQGLSITDPLDGAAANTAIAVTGIETEDTVVKGLVLNAGAIEGVVDLTKLTIVDRRASGTLTVADGIADGDKVVVNGKTYTFKTITVTPSTNVGPQIVPITLTDENGAADALAKAIMSADSSVTCEVTDNVVTIYWRVAGTVGNTKTLSAADSNGHVTASGATLAGGTATNAVKIDADTTGKKLILFWFNKQ